MSRKNVWKETIYEALKENALLTSEMPCFYFLCLKHWGRVLFIQYVTNSMFMTLM